jgi:hypothetical protein
MVAAKRPGSDDRDAEWMICGHSGHLLDGRFNRSAAAGI